MLFDLTGFQRDLLVCIAGKDKASGQDIKQSLENTPSFGTITHGRLYPNLDTLEKKNLIRKGELDRRTNYYEITDNGMNQLEKRREWEDSQLKDVPEMID